MNIFLKLFSKSISKFISLQGLYTIDFPKGWRRIYSFNRSATTSFFGKGYKGFLQVSAAYHTNPDYIFDINEELEREKSNHPQAVINTIGKTPAICWITDDKCESIVLFGFIIGVKNIRLLITYTFGYKEYNTEEVMIEYNKVCELLEGVNIN